MGKELKNKLKEFCMKIKCITLAVTLFFLPVSLCNAYTALTWGEYTQLSKKVKLVYIQGIIDGGLSGIPANEIEPINKNKKFIAFASKKFELLEYIDIVQAVDDFYKKNPDQIAGDELNASVFIVNAIYAVTGTE